MYLAFDGCAAGGEHGRGKGGRPGRAAPVGMREGSLSVQLAVCAGRWIVGALALLDLGKLMMMLLCAQLAASAGRKVAGALAWLGLEISTK